ncbi:Zuotin [Vanrija pseudolonga]|uniref:Zuotin n=1 Tax=Vanrija pseudolonga TaxID=143232 RepID=A0AAF0Y8Q6_9TREE|nr:Zuotin [Vanrija pseudolonga]
MASIVTLPLTLSAAPAGYKKAAATGKPSAPIARQVYPAGPSYISYARRELLQISFAEDDEATSSARAAQAAAAAASANGQEYPGLGEEEEHKDLLASDPKEWKKQDHYGILGLGHLRYKATDDHIRVAHRRKVLRHHPDKKADHDDGFFKCIQKAHETLTDNDRRRQFDSVDWNIEDEVPNPAKVPADQYTQVWGPIFAREGRFSNIQPVAEFGGPDAPKKEVEGFYDFWYNFDSWRSFEWHDKEANEGADSRDEKRHTEKKNKSERQRLKKEDNTRLRTLVDNVLANDPRIKRIKDEEKAARLAKKKGGATPAPKKLTPAEIKKAAEQKRKEEEEAKKAEAAANQASKADREAAKKAKEAARKNLKKWKKSIATVISGSNYFQAAGTAPSAAVIEKQLAELDAIVDLAEPEDIKTLKEKIEAAGNGEPAKKVLQAQVAALGDKGAGKFTEFA